MEKLLILLMVLLFAVGITNSTIFDENGIQTDAVEMKDNTQNIVKDANDSMETFGGATTPTTPATP
ncbi:MULTISPECIES: hypothetical protein [Bacillaceae]|uniref:Secreted protein n=1 Tax=Metabacillus endolithicus TaxID=1535204 RepID=A0ABW5C647_9BACI|nr:MULTISPECIES: hypothetical protein [Bacillaceae]MCM3164134.1 hypothetical protein [Metabacillus litoralis]PGT84057.1 hypothetical protein COD11_11545 [Bacillus sp. AFS040349]UGB33761.1 hypothetical protein LPC09_26285 [Metabacillus sp. B2-18]UPG66113.1 hypothetical protein MVE64_27120 [Metabacillus endolithicus]